MSAYLFWADANGRPLAMLGGESRDKSHVFENDLDRTTEKVYTWERKGTHMATQYPSARVMYKENYV